MGACHAEEKHSEPEQKIGWLKSKKKDAKEKNNEAEEKILSRGPLRLSRGPLRLSHGPLRLSRGKIDTTEKIEQAKSEKRDTEKKTNEPE